MTALMTIFVIVLFLVFGFEGIMYEYDIDLIVIAIASMITGLLFVKENKRVPTQNESMTYLISAVIIIIVILSALIFYRIKPLVDSGEIVLTKELINRGIALFVEYSIKYILVIYLPFYLICRLLVRRYKE
jgi:hypothetical protein